MTTVEQTLSEFVDAWNAGDRPTVEDYLARVSRDDREELAEQLETWLLIAPTPAYSAETRAAMAEDPALQRALAAFENDRGSLRSLLRRLRSEADLSTARLAAFVVEAFSLPKADEPRARQYLEGVESGDIAPQGLSRRLLDVIGAAVGETGERLAQAAAVRPRPATDATFFRADEDTLGSVVDDLDVLAQAAFAPAPPAGAEPDELDRLFRGGLDA